MLLMRIAITGYLMTVTMGILENQGEECNGTGLAGIPERCSGEDHTMLETSLVF